MSGDGHEQEIRREADDDSRESRKQRLALQIERKVYSPQYLDKILEALVDRELEAERFGQEENAWLNRSFADDVEAARAHGPVGVSVGEATAEELKSQEAYQGVTMEEQMVRQAIDSVSATGLAQAASSQASLVETDQAW